MSDELTAVAIPLIVALTAWVRAEVANRNLKRYVCRDALTCPNRRPLNLEQIDPDLGAGGTTD